MTNHNLGLHHFHTRKMMSSKQKLHKWKKVMDKAIYVVSIGGIVMTIPQITEIWIEKNASGVSTISWIAYLVAAIFWFFYGILHKEKPIIYTNGIWILLDLFIVLGTIWYG